MGYNQHRTADEDLERAVLKSRAVELRRQNMTFREIGAELGIAHNTAIKYYQEALDDITASQVRHLRAEANDRAFDASRELWAIGRDVKHHGQVRVAAYGNLLKWEEHVAKLNGTYAPVHTKVDVINHDAMDVAVAELHEKIAREKALEATVPADDLL